MTHRHLQDLSGIGQLEVSGQPTLTIRYHIDVEQRMINDRGGEVPGLLRLEGRVFPENGWALIPYVGAATLVLANGRPWECNLIDNDGNLSHRHGEPPS
jgi:hypothetical protein